MKVLITSCIFLVFLLLNVNCISYKNAKVVEFKIETENQLNVVKNLELLNGYKFWCSPTQINSKVELVVQSFAYLDFQEMANENGIEYEVLTDDIQSWFDKEKSLKSRKDDTITFDQYRTFDDINIFLDEMHSQYPNMSEIFTIGKSFEGRDIRGIKITKNEQNPIIFIDANIHAREWISSATAVWLINELLSNEDENVREIVDKMTWIIVPVLNPDGYIYTHEEDRLWRKTRSTHASLLCYGADPNRNFAYNFMMGGSSAIPCTDTFAGLHPYSEFESKALVEFYDVIHEKVKIYLSFHSAAEMLLYPMGHTGSFEEVPNVDDLNAIALATITALNTKHGTVYQYGSSFNTLSIASGTSKDHMYGHFKTPISFTYEFRAAKVDNRFILPTDEIIPNSEEAFDGILAMIVKSSQLGYF